MEVQEEMRALYTSDEIRKSNTFAATIEEVRDRYILVSFIKDGHKQNGYIFMKNLGLNTVEEGTLDSLFHVGQTINAETIGYANYISRWLMRVAKA